MPTPAWSVLLHHDVSVENGLVELVMQTIEPSSISNSVISWIYFETSVHTTESVQPDVLVKCAGETIWTSQDG